MFCPGRKCGTQCRFVPPFSANDEPLHVSVATSDVGSIGVGGRLHVRLVQVDRIVHDLTIVRMSSWRVMNSVIVYMSLVCGPPRLRYPSLRCVVVTFSVLPIHSPVEKPVQLCGAYAGGCGRPSMKIGRSSERMN